MKFGPVLLYLTQRVCSPENLKERIRSRTGLLERIQEELEFTESPFTISKIEPWYSGLRTGLTGYEILFFAGRTRVREISLSSSAPVEHHIDLGHRLPSTVIASMPGRSLGDIIGEMGIMEPYWDPNAEILDIVRTNDTPWAVFQPKQGYSDFA